MTGNIDIARHLTGVRQRIAEACRQSGRDESSVTLVAVSKTQPAAAIEQAAAAGQRDFAESYSQEALAKRAGLKVANLIWHFIGPIQSNKTRDIAENFDWVHGVDRLRIAERLSVQRPACLRPLQICVQVNISAETSKSGVPAEAALPLCQQIVGMQNLQLRGLMAVPAPDDVGAFRRLRELSAAVNAGGISLDTLSMGMSGDFEAAIAEGATLVRVGASIFGQRQ